MFIYLTMQGLGELVEVFSQLIQMEQGALGLFFELNYILGVVLYIICFIFVFNDAYKPDSVKGLFKPDSKDTNIEMYTSMYHWIYF